jgi:hypothetical protein
MGPSPCGIGGIVVQERRRSAGSTGTLIVEEENQ